MDYPTTGTSITGSRSDAADIINSAKQSTQPREVEAGRIYTVVNNQGGIEVLDTERFADRPNRTRGLSVSVSDTDSFTRYLAKHGIPGETEILAEEHGARFHATINAGTTQEAGWRDHGLYLRLEKTPEMLAWESINGKLLTQEQFAEFLEDHAPDIVQPTGAEMLEIASSLQVARGVDFESARRLSDGNVQFGYRETTTAKAGTAGQLDIPTEFQLGISPFKGVDPYRITARFRYRLNGSELRLGIKLDQLDLIHRNAFNDVAEVISEYAETYSYLFLRSN